MHYQRLRREDGEIMGEVGRPRTYAEGEGDKFGGAPRMSVRLEPEVYEWVKSLGGGAWLRHAARELAQLAEDPEFLPWWERFLLPEPER